MSIGTHPAGPRLTQAAGPILLASGRTPPMDKGQRTIGIVAIAMLAATAIVSIAGPAGPPNGTTGEQDVTAPTAGARP